VFPASDYDYLQPADDDYEMTQSDDAYSDVNVAFDYDSRESRRHLFFFFFFFFLQSAYVGPASTI